MSAGGATGPGDAGHAELLEAVEAPKATLFELISLLVTTSDNVALQFRVCQRLLQFPLDMLSFWVPELVHVFVSVETESAALEDMLLELSMRSTHIVLAVFWFLQAAIHDLKNDPHSYGFVAAKRLTNKLQYVLFATGEPPQSTQMHENSEPAMVLASMVAALAVPQLGERMKPLLVSQGRKQRSSYWIRQVVSRLRPSSSSAKAGSLPPTISVTSSSSAGPGLSSSTGANADRLGYSGSVESNTSDLASPSITPPEDAGRDSLQFDHDPGEVGLAQLGLAHMGSQPNLTFAHQTHSMESLSLVSQTRSMPALSTRVGESPITALKTNYFRCETQFVYALNAISQRLLQVPKDARQSALQVELAQLNEDLPNAEVDLPMLLPQRHSKQNRIVRICVSEATVLNSAEKAPFLLLIEYLRGDLTFDPQQQRNREILRADPKLKTHIFERPAYHHGRNMQSPRISNELAGIGGRQITPDLAPALQSGSVANSPARSITESDLGEPSGGVDLGVDLGSGDLAASVELDISEVSLLEREELAQQARRPGAVSSSSTSSHAHHHARHLSRGLPVDASELSAATQVQETQHHHDGPSAADLATQWRTASLILAQLDDSPNLPRAEVEAIRRRIIASIQTLKNDTSEVRGEAGERRLENDLITAGLHAPEDDDDPSAANLGEDWQARRARIRRTSQYGNHPNWDLVSVIVKTGDDLRQEALASQLIQRAAQIWKEHDVGVWVRRMQILITSANSGLVETITNALSLHSIKKALTASQVSEGGDPRSIAQLSQHFEVKFGPPNSNRHYRAVRNFVQSLAAYSVLCYVLQIKDRHNGNILVDAEGHIIHIDFGFMLSNSPGHIGFEANTFKLTQEYVDLMGGTGSEHWTEFMSLLVSSFLSLRTHADEFVKFVQIMAKNSTLPCFSGGAVNTAQQLRQRFMPDLSDADAAQAFERLVWRSYGSLYTRLYDQFQLVTQGIYS